MARPDDLEALRRWYAEEIRWSARLKSKRVVEAFATVPRERFMGRGPWQIIGTSQFDLKYNQTSSANPRHLYHNILVAIDTRRGLNNGLPSFLANLIERLNLRDGDTVCHIGCGTGYYSAILAELVGRTGGVVAVEVDKELARRAKSHLRSYQQVEVVSADGFAYDPGRVNAYLINAGVSQLSPVWLNTLRKKGRMVVPLAPANLAGQILRVVRTGRNWQARFISPVGIFACSGGRSKRAESRLKKALKGGGSSDVRSLRLDRHRRSRECWLHGDNFCLSRLPWREVVS